MFGNKLLNYALNFKNSFLFLALGINARKCNHNCHRNILQLTCIVIDDNNSS